MNVVQQTERGSVDNQELIQQILVDIAKLRGGLDDIENRLRGLLAFDVERGLQGAVAAWKRFTRPSDAPLPDLERVVGSFSKEQMQAVQLLRSPRLVLRPKTSFAELVRRIDESGIGLIRSQTYVNAGVFGSVDREKSAKRDTIEAWEAIFQEGKDDPGIATGDDPKKPLLERRNLVRASRHPRMKGTDRYDYAALMMQSLAEGKPVDTKTFTGFDADEACSDTCFPNGDWSGGQVLFHDGHPGIVSGDGRFRSSVRADMHS